MNIHGINPAEAAKGIEPVSAANAAKPATQAAGVSDTVEISAAARLAARIEEIPPVRAELVERVKAEIAAGTYETPERIEIAVDRLMEELFPEL
ncbi:MAG TPA: flagellar biosynthesis anti-sigma factor FlgM [Phycisphaerae bacterium]|nr:flagellar biosynthesis anti-sigma factor FlgM [Phycisphaerae bacterium]